jgi:hypothetical protein
MQTGSINCPAHGSVVSCSGPDGSAELTGVCPYGETLTMAPQSLEGPFAQHWNPGASLAVTPTTLEPDLAVIDLEKLVSDVGFLRAANKRLDVRIKALESVQKAEVAAATPAVEAEAAEAP